jgi:hypothetical protein
VKESKQSKLKEGTAIPAGQDFAIYSELDVVESFAKNSTFRVLKNSRRKSMKAHLFTVAVAGLLVALGTASASADDAKAVDIKRVAPADAFLAVYARHNPERDYQREYFAEAWKTFHEEHIGERLMDITTSHLPADKLAAAKSKWD